MQCLGVTMDLSEEELEVILSIGPLKCVGIQPSNESVILKLADKRLVYKPLASIEYYGLTQKGRELFNDLNDPGSKLWP